MYNFIANKSDALLLNFHKHRRILECVSEGQITEQKLPDKNLKCLIALKSL